MKKLAIKIACYLNRNLRYGNSRNKLLQYVVIRSRFLLKKFINKNQGSIHKMGGATIDLPYAGKMNLHLNDYIDNWLYTGADFEPSIVRQVNKILSKGDNFLDLGANIGYFSLIASRLVTDTGKVYAFEPTPSTIKRLKHNITLNHLQNILLFEKAVSNKSGEVVFKTPADHVKNSGRSSMRDIEENYTELRVPMVSLNEMINDLLPVKLIKMDIEGAEGLALEGMTNLLERDKPVIIMELSDHYLKQMGYSAQGVLDFFWKRNYTIYKGENFDELISSAEILKEYQYDILCLPQPSNTK